MTFTALDILENNNHNLLRTNCREWASYSILTKDIKLIVNHNQCNRTHFRTNITIVIVSIKYNQVIFHKLYFLYKAGSTGTRVTEFLKLNYPNKNDDKLVIISSLKSIRYRWTFPGHHGYSFWFNSLSKLLKINILTLVLSHPNYRNSVKKKKICSYRIVIL